jgi:hypothetical protein
LTAHPHRRELRLVLESAAVGLVVGLAVVAPWTGRGYLMLLDWVSGPEASLDAGVYGLSGSSLDSMPFRLGAQVLRHLIGPPAAAWVLLLIPFPLLAGGIGHLAGGRRWRRHPAALAAVCNPFVIERVGAGHVAFLLGMALLPWLARSAATARTDGRRFSARTAGWYGLAIAISPHAAWLGGAVLLAGALLPRPTRRDLTRTAWVVLAAAAVYIYGAVLLLTGTRTIAVSQADLDAYATRAGPGGLFVTVLSLHGYWRGGDDLPRDVLGLFGVVVLAIVLTAVVAGLSRLWVAVPVVGRPWAVLTAVSLLLGMGVDGPLGGLYRLAFDHVPLFAAMREQEKWLALAVVGYSLGLGSTVEALAAWQSRPGLRRVPVAVATSLALAPLVCAPMLVNGLGGKVHTSSYPAPWYAADRLMGTGPEGILFLPWHGYQPLSMTDGRSVATAGPAFFRRAVLGSDAVELQGLRSDSVSRRTAYVDRLVADGGAGGRFAEQLVPMGIRYVALARGPEDPSYEWLRKQRGLSIVLDTPQITVWEVAGARAGRLERLSPTAWLVRPGAPGVVILPEEWSASWLMDGRPGRPTRAGTIAFNVDAARHEVIFAPWGVQRLGVAGSLLALLALLVTGLVEHRHSIRGVIRGHRPAGHATEDA